MSDKDTSHTSVLLPTAHIALFSADEQTREVFLSLEQDWRFARVGLSVKGSSVADAVSLFQGEASPELILIQTDEIDDSFLQKLESLAGVCAEGTAAIIIGPVNDVNLYRKLVGMGVSDYLVKPVQKEPLANDIAATLIEKVGASGSRLIAMIGAKGGVGTTALSEALAWGLSDGLGQKTFLMDAAGGWSTLSVGMNFEPTTTLKEAARAASEDNQDSLTRMLFSAGDKLTVLSSGGDVMLDDSVSSEQYETLIDMLMITYPVVVVDLSASAADLRRLVLSRAHEIMLITVPTLPSVRAARTLIHEIKEIRGGGDDIVDIIVNMTGLAPKHEVTKAQIEGGLDRSVSAEIPFDPNLFISIESQARKMSADKAGAAIVDKILPLARKILEGVAAESGGAAEGGKKGGIEQFLSKLKAKS